jgi:ATP-binding cassette, subfamily F, member 3
MLLSCKNVSKFFGENTILKDINFLLNEKDKVAIVGVNGAGKTTLFKILIGEISYDTGELIIPKNKTLGYLSQIATLNLENTIYEEMITVFSHVIQLEDEIRNAERKMGSLAGDELEIYLKNYETLNQKFEDLKGYEYKSRIKGVIKGLGFLEEEWETPIKALSGGQKTRISLGKTLLTNPDLLLLDEPTNHLDIASIEWLEDFLRNYDKGVLVISHDRYFLNNVSNKVIEIENKKATVYFGNYTHFVNKKEETRELNIKHYLNQQKEIKKQEESIKKLKSYNREKSIKRAESKEKMLNKIELIEKPDKELDVMKLTFTPRSQSGVDVLKVEELTKSFNTTLFDDVTFEIIKGDKIALVGGNGVGKTTLVKIIRGIEKQTSGTVKLGVGVKIAFYDQEQEGLNFENTIFDEVSNAHPNLTNLQIRSALAAFMFMPEDINKKILNLSGGEKGRVVFIKIMLSDANFLILDEPTNHLDMASKEILEKAINNYEGTVMYISHDRYFINSTAKNILELSPKGIKKYIGNYDYYVERKPQDTDDVKQSFVQNEEKDSKNDWAKKKEEEASARKNVNKIKKLEEEIEQCEAIMKEIEKQMLLEEVVQDLQKLQDLYTLKEEEEVKVDKLYKKWEELQ